MGRLANTMFQGRSTDAMVVEDAYKVSTQETRNSLYDSSKGVLSDAVKGVYANKNSIRELASIVMDAKSGRIDKLSMLTRGLSALGSSLPSLLGTLGGTIKNKFEGYAGDLIGDDAKKYVGVIYDNAEYLVQAADVSNMQDAATLLAGITGNSDLMKVINIEAESAIIGGMASEFMSFGIPDLMDDVIDQARSPTVKQNAWAYISTSSIEASNIVMINRSIDNIGITRFLEANPQAVSDVLSSYYLGTDDGVTVYPQRLTELVATLVRIDANWDKVLRNGVYIQALQPFGIASSDARKLFMSTDVYRTWTMASPKYLARSVQSISKDLYPAALIS